MKILKSTIFFILCYCLIAFIQTNSNVCNAIPTSFAQNASIQKSFNYLETDNNTHSIYVANSNQELSTASQRKRVDLLNQNSFNFDSLTKNFLFVSATKSFYKGISYTPPKLFLTELYINAP